MAYSREKTLDSAQRCLSKGQYAKAAVAYREVVKHEPRDLRIWLRLADAHLRAGQQEEAVECFVHVGAAYEDSEDVAKALAVYRQAVSADRERIDILYKCAELYRALGRTAECVDSYEHIAQTHLNRGEVDKAVELYAHVVQLEPRSVSRRLRLGEIYSREQRVGEAVAVFRQSCTLLLEAQDYAQYIRVAERLLYHREDDEVARELVRVYLAVNQPRRALVKLNALLQKNHSDCESLELLAETFWMMGRQEKALSVIVELARAARGLGAAAQEAASRAVLRGLDELPDNPELVRIGTELSESMPEVDEVQAAGPSTALPQGQGGAQSGLYGQPAAAPQARSSQHSPGVPQVGAQLDGIDAGQLAGLDLDVHSSQESPASVELPEDVKRVMVEARVLIKYALLDHAHQELERHRPDYAEHPEFGDLQAELLTAQGDADGAYRLRLGLAQRLEKRDRHGALFLLDQILATRPADAAATATKERLLARGTDAQTQAAFDSAQTSNLDAVPPLPAANLGGQSASASGSMEIEIDIEPSPDPNAAIASAFEPVHRPEPSIAETQPADPEELSTSRSLGLPALERPSSAPITQSHPSLAPPPMNSSRPATGSFSAPRPSFKPAIPSPSRPAVPPPAAADKEAAQALGAWGVARSGATSLPSPQSAIFDEVEEEHSVGPETFIDNLDEINIEEIEEIDEIEEIEDFDAIELEDVSQSAVSSPQAAPFKSTPTPRKSPYSAEAAAVESLGEDPSVEELNELRFFLQEDLQDEAAELFADLRVRFGDTHPALGPYFSQFGQAPPQQELLSALNGAGIEPLLSEAEADAALNALSPLGEVEHSFQDLTVSQAGRKSARERLDLALAYRDMGLVPNAIAELNGCLEDRAIRGQAALILGQLERSRGQLDASAQRLEQAMGWATNSDESQDARYELGLTFEQMSRPDDARRCWSELPAAYRDVRQRLSRSG